MTDTRRKLSDSPPRWQQRSWGSWGSWVEFGALLAGNTLVILYTPFAYVFGSESFEARHGYAIYIVSWIVGKSLYLYVFRRKESAAELAAAKDAVRHGRAKRMSFAARWLFILCILGVVSLGWFAPEPHRTHILALAVPLFVLFCATELNIVVHPGETLMPNPRDEMLTFFKSRMLQAGYIASIAALVALYLTYLVAPVYVGLLLPAVLATCLLVPNLVYNRLDRQAGRDV